MSELYELTRVNRLPRMSRLPGAVSEDECTSMVTTGKGARALLASLGERLVTWLLPPIAAMPWVTFFRRMKSGHVYTGAFAKLANNTDSRHPRLMVAQERD